jgi:hypothetical protein
MKSAICDVQNVFILFLVPSCRKIQYLGKKYFFILN